MSTKRIKIKFDGGKFFMSKERNDLFVVIIFSIIWIVRPISYDEMRSRHPIYPQEMVINILNQQQDASLNEILSKQNPTKPDEVILVKNDGILPGADSFPLNNNPRRRHPFGRPRMRGTGITVDPPQKIQGLGNIPEAPKVRSFTEVDTGLNARRGNRGDQCPAPEFDMKKQYKNFMQEISEKGYTLECSQERFNELSTNLQTGAIDEKSLIEAKGGLQGEAQGMYTNLRRPTNKAVDLDFEINSSKGYTHVDYKTPIDFQDLADKKKIDVSNFPSLETVAYNMG